MSRKATQNRRIDRRAYRKAHKAELAAYYRAYYRENKDRIKVSRYLSAERASKPQLSPARS